MTEKHRAMGTNLESNPLGPLLVEAAVLTQISLPQPPGVPI